MNPFDLQHRPVVLVEADHDDAAASLYDRGLEFDLGTVMDRRRVIKLIGLTGLSAGLASVVGCAPSAATPAGSSSAVSTAASAAASSGATGEACSTIPEETAGPFPGDGSNGPDVLNQSGIVRSDIRSSFGSS